MAIPLYKVGQVVVIKNSRREMPFKILKAHEEDGLWYYAWNRNNFAAESMLRPLNDEEIGIANLHAAGRGK